MNSTFKRNNIIRYKVIRGLSRCSAIINGANRYCLRYPINATVFARPETIGILVFKSYRYAMNWLTVMCRWPFQDIDEYKIIKVAPIGKGKVPGMRDLCNPEHSLYTFYEHRDEIGSNFFHKPPDGTICYRAVHTLE